MNNIIWYMKFEAAFLVVSYKFFFLTDIINVGGFTGKYYSVAEDVSYPPLLS